MRRLALLLCLAAPAAAGGCGDGDDAAQAPPPRTTTAERTATERTPSPPPLTPARCPAGAANCASATGRVVYVEKVDPDGDGDAHIVLLGGNVTGRGLSVVDVRRDLRPDPLPRPGDTVTAAGPVYPGSYGQRQIQAERLRVRRR